MTRYTPGRNIAIKLPERDYEATLAFYRDVIGLTLLEQTDVLAVFEFGQMRLNLDRIPHQSQTDIWFQIQTDDTASARSEMAAKGVTICDEVEPLPDGFDGFWIAAPSGTIHLIDAQT